MISLIAALAVDRVIGMENACRYGTPYLGIHRPTVAGT